jgi:NTP pyrophosphatase (non-canonical NTP hydrolase)
MGYLTDGLTFNVLRDANRQRLPTFRNAKGEISHPADKDGHNDNWSLTDWCTAVTGELGEAANIIKKIRRGDFSLEDARAELAKELADVQTYLDLLAMAAGVDLGKATIAKFNEVSERVDSNILIREDGSDWRYSDRIPDVNS